MNLSPSRLTVFYCLEPVGVRTAHVESLTSYIARLAAAHYLTPNILLAEGIIPLLNERNYSRFTLTEPATFRPSGLWSNIKWLNGASQLTRNLIQLLEELTGRLDLRATCFLSLDKFISNHNMVKRYRAWCPACLNDYARAGQPIYEPLLWQVVSVTGCTIHRQLLQTRCPACTKSSPPLTSRMVAGYCGYCGAWLGKLSKTTGQEINALEQTHFWDTQERITNDIGELLAVEPHKFNSTFPVPTPLSIRLKYWAKLFTRGNWSVLRRYLDISGGTWDSWMIGKHTPNLETLLILADRLGTSPLKLLCGETPIAIQLKLPLDEVSQISKVRARTKARAAATERIANVEVVLKKYVTQLDILPPPLCQLAQQYGCIPASLYRQYGELSRAVTYKRRQVFARLKTERQRKLQSEMQQVINDLHHAGIYPSHAKVAARLPHLPKGARRRSEFVDCWRSVMQAIGYPPTWQV